MDRVHSVSVYVIRDVIMFVIHYESDEPLILAYGTSVNLHTQTKSHSLFPFISIRSVLN